MAKVRNLLPDESDHFLEKDKIKDFNAFSVDVISHSFHGVEIIKISSKNEVLFQSFISSFISRIMHQQILAMGLTYAGKKSTKLKHYFALSRSVYSRMREDYELPNITTLTRLTSKVKTLDDMSYMQKVSSWLDDERQKRCLLIVDEVYVKSI